MKNFIVYSYLFGAMTSFPGAIVKAFLEAGWIPQRLDEDILVAIDQISEGFMAFGAPFLLIVMVGMFFYLLRSVTNSVWRDSAL